MVKSNNGGILVGRIYNVKDRGKLVSFSIGILEYNNKTKETEMKFYPVIAIYDNLKNLLTKLENGTAIALAYSLYTAKNKNGYDQIGIRAEDITLLSSKSNDKKTRPVDTKKEIKKEEDVDIENENEDDLNIELEGLDEDIRKYFH